MKDSLDKKNYLERVKEALQSQVAKISGTIAIIAALTAMSAQDLKAQTIENKKGYKDIEATVDVAQEKIGKDMAKFIFAGGIERQLQINIEKQNSKNEKGNAEYSLFKNKNIQKNDSKEYIKSKTEMEEKIKKSIDSLVTNDITTYYLAFQKFQKEGKNLLGHKKGKGGAGWELLPFNFNENMTDNLIEGFENDEIKLPYSKKQLETTVEGFVKIYKKGLTTRQKTALENRKSLKKEEYESANLLSLEETRLLMVEEIYEKYGQTIVEKVFNQFYGLDKKIKK